MCRPGLCTCTPAGGAMSAAVTRPGPRLRRYIGTGSSCSEETASSFRFKMMSVTSSVTPGNGGDLVQHSPDPDTGHRRTGDRGQQGPADRVPDRVAETRLQRLHSEPG